MGGQLCIECGRDDFKSSKALHGHLRRHPERNYRGINPTSRRNFDRQKRKDMGSGGRSSGTTTSSSPAVQEPVFVKPLSWYPPDQSPPPVKKLCSKTHNRRYPSDASNTYNLSILATASSSLSAMPNALQVNPPPRPHTSHDMSPRPTAISIGRNLAKLDPNSFSQAADSQLDEPDTNSSSEAAMQEPFLHIDSHPSDKTVISSTHNLSLEANLKEGDGPGTTSSFTVEESMEEDLKRKRTIEDELICGVLNQLHNKRGSSCNICSKSFDSYQALGGHMTSHIDKSKAIGSESGKATEHPCNICGDIYPTGQALGGHKRKHWKAPQTETLPQPATQPQPQPENKLPGFMFFGAWFSASP